MQFVTFLVSTATFFPNNTFFYFAILLFFGSFSYNISQFWWFPLNIYLCFVQLFFWLKWANLNSISLFLILFFPLFNINIYVIVIQYLIEFFFFFIAIDIFSLPTIYFLVEIKTEKNIKEKKSHSKRRRQILFTILLFFFFLETLNQMYSNLLRYL